MATANYDLHIERAYDDPAPNRYRVLIDRLWPRGVKKEDLDIDDWLKDLAPSTELRKWYGHEPERFTQFKEKYLSELKHNDSNALQVILEALNEQDVALITSTKDVEHSGAVVLREYLKSING